jgi:protein-disulfide isomerase
MRRLNAGLILLICTLTATLPVSAASSGDLAAIRDELATLRKEQAAIAAQVREIRGLLEPRAAAKPGEAAVQSPNIVLATAGAPSVGAGDAPLMVIEFVDYQCPFCARHFRETFPELRKQYIDTGKVRYVMRHFPLEAIHSESFKAHAAARCADEQGKYWQMHARLLTNQDKLDRKGLELKAFGACLDSGRQEPAIRADMAAGTAAGVTGTPSFFLGRVQPGSTDIKMLKTISGAQSLAAFQHAIDEILNLTN